MPEWGGPLIRWVTDKITFPSPPSSYSLTSHPELFFVKAKKGGPAHPGIPCMLYAIPQGAPVVLVHVHSNGCDIGDMRQMLQSISEQLRVHVMSFELPGYGLHLGKSCNRGTIDAVASAVREFLLEELSLNPAQVVWYGRSIGSGPAVYQAYLSQKELKKPPGGLVLQCAYASFPELAGHLFGSWVKSLVPVNWPNEVMIKDLKCPILLLHGRADTMIPICQAERNFAAVSSEAKELSRFHACDCGHNDFNFQRCTLRPIYDFLLGIISADNFPSNNFHIDLAQSSRAFVHHIGILRNRIPVYSFRHPELAEWLRRLQLRKQQTLEASAELRVAGQDNPTAQAIERRGQDNGIMGGFQKQALEGPGKNATVQEMSATGTGTVDGEGKGEQTAKKKKKKKKKGDADEAPPIPNFCDFEPLKEVEEALLDPEGMIRVCAHRVESFLTRLQLQLDQVDGLEGKPVEEVIEIVEAEFWASDPLLCLWEEVRLPHGDWVRTRLGPFYIESSGVSGYDPDLGAGRTWAPDLLRVPLWVFCPSAAHFRCLAEWTLLRSERLERNLPSGHGSACCCNPCSRSKRKRRTRTKRGVPDTTQHPTRGVLATSLAAHFVNWVDKTEEVKAIFTRFTDLHRHPEQVVGKSLAAALSAPGQPRRPQAGNQEPQGETHPPPPQPHQPPDADNENTLGGPSTAATPAAAIGSLEELGRAVVEPIASALSALSASAVSAASLSTMPAESPANFPKDAAPKDAIVEESPWWYADLARTAGSAASSGQPLRRPWTAPVFSAATRSCLREATGVPGGKICDFYASLWHSEASQETQPLVTGDFKACNDILMANTSLLAVPDRNADWLAANLLLHWARLPRRPLPSEQAMNSDKVGDDFMRPEMRQAALALNKAMKIFAHAEHRERREHMRQRFRPAPKVPLPPDVPPDGDTVESKPAPTMGKPANPVYDKGAAPVPEPAETKGPVAGERQPNLTSLGDSPASSAPTDAQQHAAAPPPSSRTL